MISSRNTVFFIAAIFLALLSNAATSQTYGGRQRGDSREGDRRPPPAGAQDRVGYREAEGRAPFTPDEVREIDRRFALTIKSQAATILPGTYRRSLDENGAIRGNYTVRKNIGGESWNMQFTVERLADGRPCFHYGNGICEKLVGSEAEADSAGASKLARDRQEVAEERLNDRAKALASARREVGALLNPQDQACLRVSTEEYFTNEKTGVCLRGFRHERGDIDCSEWQYERRSRTKTLEKNVCSYTIRFKDICGSTVFDTHEIGPGETFLPRLGPPCYRAY